MGVLVVNRKQISHAWPGANQVSIQQLNKSLAYRDITIRLAGQSTLLAANNTVANTLKGDEWAIIKRVRILANSSDILFDITGDQLWWLNRYWFGNKPLITVGFGDGVTANPAFNSVLVLPFWALRCGKPMDSVFDSGGLTDFRMEITWGTFTDINAAATAWTAAPTLTVSSQENELTPAFYPPLVKRQISQQLLVAGPSTNFRFNLDVGPLFRGMLINACNSGAPFPDTPGLITNIRLVSGSTIFVDLDEVTLNQMGILKASIPFAIEKVVTTGLGFYPSPRISASSDERAWYNLDLVTDGYLSECINTARFNEFYLEFAVSGACQINVLSHEFLSNPRMPMPNEE